MARKKTNEEQQTTIKIPMSLAERIDTLIKGTFEFRKDFISYAVDHFEKSNFDLNADVYGFTREEEIKVTLAQHEKVINDISAQNQFLALIAQKIQNGYDPTKLLLPADDVVRIEAQEKADLLIKYNSALNELKRVKKQLSQVNKILKSIQVETDF